MAGTPLQRQLAQKISKKREEIDQWVKRQASEAPPPFYCSVDLRDSGHKIAPVDSNLFPGGFNNICPEDVRTAPAILRAQVEISCALQKRDELKKPPTDLLIIPENHTQNRFYIENVAVLSDLLKEGGFNVTLGWNGPVSPEDPTAPILLTSQTERVLKAYPIERRGDSIYADGRKFQFIILNNDFSAGHPVIFDGVDAIVAPDHQLGWHSRKKSCHFVHYNALAGEFAAIIGVDPWILQVDTEEVGPVNFGEDAGTAEVAAAVERVLARTKAQYEAHKITREPAVFIKNNAGTYGIGIMVAHSADEIRNMNRRTKNKMSVGKNKAPIASVVVQESIPTVTLVDKLPAEPVIYLAGTELIGGFLRTNTERGDEDNLNSQGMVFRKLCMSDLREIEGRDADAGAAKLPVLELVYGSIARISALAAGREVAVGRRKS